MSNNSPFPLFVPIPSYPVGSVAPYTYREGMTQLEKLQALNGAVASISNLYTDLTGNMGTLITDTNRAIETALQSMSTLKNSYDTALADMQAKLDKQLSDVGTKVAQLNEAIQQANSANTEAKGIVAEFAQLANSYTATLAEYENRMTTELASVRSEMNSKVSKNALTFNVRDFGAKGDGTNDDTSAFKAAISAAGESGDVFIPQGKYVITQTLTVPRYTRLRGTSFSDGDDNEFSGILARVTSGPAIELKYNAGIQDLAIRGNNAGVGVTCVGGVRIVNVNVQRFDTAVYCNEVWYGDITRLRTYRNKISLDVKYCYNLTVTTPQFACLDYNGNPGIGIRETNQCDVKVIGGAIEAYDTGLQADNNTSTVFFGVYFETAMPTGKTYEQWPGGTVAKVGMLKNFSVGFYGCFVYMTNTINFVNANGDATEGRITSIGNTFKGGNPAGNGAPRNIGFSWSQGGVTKARFTLLNDLWYVQYWDNADYMPYTHYPQGNSFVMVPDNGTTGLSKDMIFTGGNLVSTGTFMRIPQNGSHPAMTGTDMPRLQGATYYNGVKKKPYWWNGTRWCDVNGNPE